MNISLSLNEMSSSKSMFPALTFSPLAVGIAIVVCRRRELFSPDCVDGRDPLFTDADLDSPRAWRPNLRLSSPADFRNKVFVALVEGFVDAVEGVFNPCRDVVLARFGVDPVLLDDEDPKDFDVAGLSDLVLGRDWMMLRLHGSARSEGAGTARNEELGSAFASRLNCIRSSWASLSCLVCCSRSC